MKLTNNFPSVWVEKFWQYLKVSQKYSSQVYQHDKIGLVSQNLSLLSLHDRPLNISIHKTKEDSQNKSWPWPAERARQRITIIYSWETKAVLMKTILQTSR